MADGDEGKAKPRRLLMDDFWVKVQHKTFGKWVSMHLAKKGIPAVANLDQELKDGLKLIALLEVLSGEPFKSRYEKKPRIRIQMMQNLDLALQFIRASGVKLTNIGAGDLCDGNLKLVLGLIWTIIQKFVIADISLEELTAKEALLLWCQRKTEPYSSVKVKEFTHSFKDGLAFIGLIHRHRPDLVPNPDTLDKSKNAENLELAFSVAYEKLGIHRLLDVEDMEYPDERSVITYVSEYYRVFASSQKQEIAGRRVAKLVALTKALEKMKQDYDRDASNLTDWIEAKTKELEGKEFDNTLDCAQQQTKEYQTYRTDERPPKAAEKVAVAQSLKTLQMRLKANRRPEYQPEISIEDLDQRWNTLENVEKDYQAKLRAELERQQKIASLLGQFRPKYDQLVEFSNREKNYFETEEEISTLSKAQGCLKALDQHDKELDGSQRRVDQLNNLGQKILDLNAKESDEVKEKMGDVESRWAGLRDASAVKRKRLLDVLAREQEKERLRKLFADLANGYVSYVNNNKESIRNSDFGDSLESVRDYQAVMDKENGEINGQSSAQVSEIENVWKQLEDLGVKDNRYTPLTFDDIKKKEADLQQSIAKRSEDYAAELARQEEMEAKRIEFANAAQAFDDFLKSDREAVDAMTGEPKDLLETLRDHHKDGEKGNNHLGECTRIEQEAKAMGITNNRHTDLTVPILSSRNRRHNTYIKNFVSELEEELALKEDFDNHAKALNDWIHATIPVLEAREFDNTLEGIRAQVAEFEAFKKNDLAEHASEKKFVEKFDASIQARLSSSQHNRPSFNPPITIVVLNESWDKLDLTQKDRREALKEELNRQQKLFRLVSRFDADSEQIQAWEELKEAYLVTDETVNTLTMARVLVSALDGFLEERNTFSGKLKELRELRDEIAGDNYKEIATIDERLNGLEAANAKLADLSNEKRARLDAHIARFDEKCKEFAGAADSYIDFLNGLRAKIDALEGEPKELTEKIDSVYQNGEEAKAKLKEVQVIDEEMKQMNITDNSHTQHTFDDLRVQTRKLEVYVQDYKLELQDEQDEKNHYDSLADAFVAWVDQTTPRLQDLSNENTLADARQKVQAFSEYKKNDKAEQAAALEVIEEIARKVQRKMDGHRFGHDRPPFSPAQPVASLKERWEALGVVEKSREDALQAELRRQENLDKIHKNFKENAVNLGKWIGQKEEYLEVVENSQSLSSAEIQVTNMNSFADEYEARREALKNLQQLANELVEGNYIDKDAVQERGNDIEASFNALAALIDSKKGRLNTDEVRETKKEELRVAFADGAKAYNIWARDTCATLQERNFGNELEGVRGFRDTLDSTNQEIGQKNDEQKAGLDDIAQQLTELQVDSNRHTSLTSENVASFHESVTGGMNTRNGAYDEALKLQEDREELRKKFAEAANTFHQEVTSKISEMKEAGKGNDPTTSSEQVAVIFNGYDAQSNHDAAADIAAQGRAIGVVGKNSHTEQTPATLQKTLTLYQQTANNLLASLKEDAELKAKKEAAQKEWEEKERVEGLVVNYAEKAQELKLWLEGANESATSETNAKSVEDAENLISENTSLLESASSQSGLISELGELAPQITDGGAALPALSPDEFSKAVEDAKGSLAARGDALQKERERQEEHDKIRANRKVALDNLNQFLTGLEGKLSDLEGDLDEQSGQLNKLDNILQTDGNGQLGEAEKFESSVEHESVVVEDTDAFVQLRSRFNELANAISSKKKVVEEEILAKQGSALSPEQLEEYRQTFDFFDKEKKGALDSVRLKGVLQSLGEDPSDEDLEAIMKKFDKGVEDGVLEFNEFVQFMQEHAADTDQADQIIEALKVLAGDKDFVTLPDLASGLSPEEVDYLKDALPAFEGVEGGYDYKAWVNKVYN